MDKLALAYVTCDKYDHVWNEWYDKFLEHWDINLPKYFCGEEEECPFDDFTQIPHEAVEAEYWTTKLRNQVEQIPEDYIFVWLDDQIQQTNITIEFSRLFEWLLSQDGDSIRIMGRGTRARYEVVDHLERRPVNRLALRSPYLVSYSPNIYKKDFLLEILQYEESPWDSELNSARWTHPRRKIYAYHIDGWILNRVIQ